MELSPQAIRSTGFRLVKKGYDPDQVDSFKDDVASVVERAYSQATAMEARARAAVAKLQQLSQHAPAHDREREQESFSPSDNEVITRTLVLAQRTADTAIAEARAEAEAILSQSREEAERLLENARSLAAKTIEDSRAEARRAVEGDRVHAENELQSLIARRDFLVSDVEHLEQYLQAQRERLREAAVALHDMVERVPGGLGEMRRPLLSASAAPVADERSRDTTPPPARREVLDESEVAFGDDGDAGHHDNTGHEDGNAIGDGGDEMSELVWDDASRAAARRAPEREDRHSNNADRARRPKAPRFNDPDQQDNVWRMLDDELASSAANAQAAEAGLALDEITTEVPVIPRASETFRVAGDELQ